MLPEVSFKGDRVMVATEKQIQDALARIDSVLAQVSLPRPQHAQLAQDLQTVQERVKRSFEKMEVGKDGRAD